MDPLEQNVTDADKEQTQAPETAGKTTNPESGSHLVQTPSAPTENAGRMIKPTGK